MELLATSSKQSNNTLIKLLSNLCSFETQPTKFHIALSSQQEKFKTNQLEPKVLNHQIHHSTCKVQTRHKIYSKKNNNWRTCSFHLENKFNNQLLQKCEPMFPPSETQDQHLSTESTHSEISELQNN